MKFGENLKLIRKSNKISQENLAEKLGVSRQSVSKWETGENYPSMTNILCLCDIFKCKINELVHEDFIDVNFLDEEIRMSVVKFKNEEQKKMKALSKAIYIIARSFKIVSIVGIVASFIFLLFSFIFIPNIKFNTTDETLTIWKEKYNYKLDNNKIKIYNYDGKDIIFSYTENERLEIGKFINETIIYKVSFCVVVSISLLLSCIFLFKMLENVEKLFVNIYENDTPFTSNNVNYVKKIALFLALYVLIPDLFGSISSLIFKLNLEVEIDIINYLFVAIIIAISYIFKYGYEIQLDSNGRIYGDENE